MEFLFIPFAHDYYIINLPQVDSRALSLANRSALFDTLKYDRKNYMDQPIRFGPVIRLYGTHKGVSSCVQVHGYFPYFYIKVEELKHLFADVKFIHTFIDHIHQAYITTYMQQFDQRMKSKFQLVFNFEVVQLKDFYGHHPNNETFLKLFLYDQQYMRQLVSLLHSGALMNYSFQSYESHIPYFMHFYADCNIFGMTPVTAQQGVFRKRFPRDMEQTLDSSGKVKASLILDLYEQSMPFSKLTKLSYCPIELDCHFTHLINQDWVDENEFLQMCRVVKELDLMKSPNKQQDELIPEFNVELTLTLNRLWRDESGRRKRLALDKLKLIMDKRGNCDSNPQREFSVSTLDRSETRQQLMQQVKEFENSATNHFQGTTSFINREAVQQFFNGQQREVEQCASSIGNRIKQYMTRKKDLFHLIKEQGNVDYEYRMSDGDDDQNNLGIPEELESEEEQDLKDIVSTSQDMLRTPNVFDVIKKNQQIRDENKFRKKYKVNRTKQFQFFKMCQFCSKSYLQCNCLPESFTMLQSRPTNQQKQQQSKSTVHIYRYMPPPNAKTVMLDLQLNKLTTVPQYVFYKPIDFFKHHRIGKIECRDAFVQYLDREVQKQTSNKFYALSIENSQRLPPNYQVAMNTYKATKRYPEIRPNVYLYLVPPPSREQVVKFVKPRAVPLGVEIMHATQMTPKHPLPNTDQLLAIENRFDLTMMTIEIFASCIEDRLPDPSKDEIDVVAMSLYSFRTKEHTLRIFLISNESLYDEYHQSQANLRIFLSIPDSDDLLIVPSELDLLRMMTLLMVMLDPDIVAGWDHERYSIAYITHRANEYEMDILTDMSRAQASYELLLVCLEFDQFVHCCAEQSPLKGRLDRYMHVRRNLNEARASVGTQKEQPYSKRKYYRPPQTKPKGQRQKKRTNIYIVGRVLLNVWRHAQSDLKLTDYSLEAVVRSEFKQQIPSFSAKTLRSWLQDALPHLRARALEYVMNRCVLTEQLLVHMDTVPKAVEIAKLYGCEFDSVGQRGSQFKIESVMCRVTKQHNYALFSATRVQVAQQKILESIPLVLEPPKMFVVDPVVVLDFQSLYPSLMIAYNLCYTTCLGNLNDGFRDGKKRFGVSNTNIGFQVREDQVHVTPNNVCFLKKSVKQGIIPQILSEFLQTRIMIKKSSGLYRDNVEIQKLYLFRQLALKFFMNVMYGYCGASFSGRMPSGDIADSVVELGRTVMNQCIQFINAHPAWRAEVLYGDTDSLFVVLRGRSNAEAHALGNEIAKEITSHYPYPMELKFEKVYNPMFLVAKKRYVGYKHERPTDTPTFEGKGIELIRRDGCPAVVKIMKKVLLTIFDTRDLSQVKAYLQKHWSKILNGHYTLNDFVIAKEVKLGKYANLLPAHAIVATKEMQKDPMKQPLYAERVKYIVVQGNDDRAKVSDLVVGLEEYLSNPNYRINSIYYVKKQINAALGRLFSTFDVDINDWFNDLPKSLAKRNEMRQSVSLSNVFTLHHFYRVNSCILCSNDSKQEICPECLRNGSVALALIVEKLKAMEHQRITLAQVCRSCSSLPLQIEEVSCREYGCHVVYAKLTTQRMMDRCSQQLVKYVDVAIVMDDY